MLRTFLAGALVAFVGSRLVRMNQEGKLDGVKDRLRDGAERLRERGAPFVPNALSPAKPAAAPAASARSRRSPSDDVSVPAPAHPWPVDPRAMPDQAN